MTKIEAQAWMEATRRELQLLAGHHLRHEFKLWWSNCSHPMLSEPDVSVGLDWFNPLTDSNVILTLTPGGEMELRDHDGDGEDLTPWWYCDLISDINWAGDYGDAYRAFFYHVRDQTTDYHKRLRTNRGGVTLFAKGV
jgi:hypothetical protein